MSRRSVSISDNSTGEHAYVESGQNALRVWNVNSGGGGGGGGDVNITQIAGNTISGNSLPINDGGNSLTVDGTVAATQSGSWTVSVDNFPASQTVDDGGSSLTVDGTVAATQSGSWTVSISGDVTVVQTTHDDLNANANLQVGNADVTNLNPVPVSDAGGSLTVDGTVAATQSGSWTVSVDNFPASQTVDDGGSSLTVDGTVAATQSGAWSVSITGSVEVVQTTHDDLNANVNLQIADADVSSLNPVPVSDAGGSLTVDGAVAATQSGSWTVSVDNFPATQPVSGTVAATQSGSWTVSVSGDVEAVQSTHDDLNANANLQVGNTDVANGNPVPISDAGGSLTVDGAVAATQSGSWTVSVDNFPATQPVSGTVAATQSGAWSVSITGDVEAVQPTHDDLNANANLQVGNTDVANGNPVPISDAGGSLTVDGAVSATQSGSWTVSVDNFPASQAVDDGGGSLTVDGTVAATQSGAWSVSVSGNTTVVQTTHDNLNANANLQVGNTDVANGNPVPVSDAGGSLTVDGTVGISGTVDIDTIQTIIGAVDVVQPDWGDLRTASDLYVAETAVNNSNPVPVSDAGGSLTVDGTVTATQSTRTNLLTNSSLQLQGADVVTSAGLGAARTQRVPVTEHGTSGLPNLYFNLSSLVEIPGCAIMDVSAIVAAGVNAGGGGSTGTGGALRVGPDRSTITSLGTVTLNATSTGNSSNFTTTTARTAVVYLDITASGSPTSVQVIPQLSRDGGTNWHDWNYENWPITYSSFPVKEAIPMGAPIGALLRVRFVGTGTSGSDTFSCQTWSEFTT